MRFIFHYTISKKHWNLISNKKINIKWSAYDNIEIISSSDFKNSILYLQDPIRSQYLKIKQNLKRNWDTLNSRLKEKLITHKIHAHYNSITTRSRVSYLNITRSLWIMDFLSIPFHSTFVNIYNIIHINYFRNSRNS